MKEYYRKVSKIVFWILLFSGTFIIGEQSDVIEIETLQASSFVGEGNHNLFSDSEINT